MQFFAWILNKFLWIYINLYGLVIRVHSFFFIFLLFPSTRSFSSLVILGAHLIYRLPRLPTSDYILLQAQGIENHVDDVYSALFNPPTETESPVGIDHRQGADNDNQTSWIHPAGSESPVSSNNDEQPSPVSVLESSLDAEEVYSGDFEKISADLQGKWPSFSLAIHFPFKFSTLKFDLL